MAYKYDININEAQNEILQKLNALYKYKTTDLIALEINPNANQTMA